MWVKNAQVQKRRLYYMKKTSKKLLALAPEFDTCESKKWLQTQ